MSLPTARTAGYGSFRGRVACDCLIEWLPVFEAELLRRGVIKHNIDIYQLTGGAAASGGTHSKGGAFDIAQTQALAVWVARQMGADATWHRPYNWDRRGGGAHTHGVLRGCPHNGPARYQITSSAYGVDHNHNGLANGAKDTGPRPLSKRTWEQGIAWAKAQAKPKTSIRFGQWNFPGDDKLPDPAARIKAAVPQVKATPLAFIGWNELIGIKRKGVASDFAHDVDAALGESSLLVKPTMLLNENYISYDRTLLSLVRQYDDQILKAATGGRHITRAVFKVKETGFVFAVGQTHLVNGSTAAHESDRQHQAADALRYMQNVSRLHDDCPFIIQGDMNTHSPLKALVDAGMKLTRTYADNSSTRNDPTYTNYSKAEPSTNPDWIIDQSYASKEFYCVGYSVRRKLDSAGNYRQPRPSDHDLVVSSVRI